MGRRKMKQPDSRYCTVAADDARQTIEALQGRVSQLLEERQIALEAFSEVWQAAERLLRGGDEDHSLLALARAVGAHRGLLDDFRQSRSLRAYAGREGFRGRLEV